MNVAVVNHLHQHQHHQRYESTDTKLAINYSSNQANFGSNTTACESSSTNSSTSDTGSRNSQNLMASSDTAGQQTDNPAIYIRMPFLNHSTVASSVEQGGHASLTNIYSFYHQNNQQSQYQSNQMASSSSSGNTFNYNQSSLPTSNQADLYAAVTASATNHSSDWYHVCTCNTCCSYQQSSFNNNQGYNHHNHVDSQSGYISLLFDLVLI